jgi:Plant mobile domain
MNVVRQWRCSLDWMPIHTVMTTSSITHNRLRQGTWRKRTSTFSSRHLVSSSRICGRIFKSCLPTLMTRPSDDIIFTTNFTPSVNLFCRYTRAFCLNLYGSVMFPNNSANSVPTVYLTFLDDVLNVPEDDYDWRQAILSCLYFNLSRSCLEPAYYITGPLPLLQMWSWTRFPIGRPR